MIATGIFPLPPPMFPTSVRLLLAFLTLLSPLGGCVASPPSESAGQVVARLLTLLKDPAPDVRRTAALSLGKIGEPAAATALRDGLSDADERVRQYSAWALGNLGEEGLKQAGLVLVETLKDPSLPVKAAAAEAIGKLGGTDEMVELLSETLKDPDPVTRQAVVQALGWLEAPSSYPALLTALRDREAPVRQGVVAALGELADQRVIPALRMRLLKDPDVGVRSEAAFRLGKLGDDLVLPTLQFISLKDEDPRVRRWAQWAMASIQSVPN